MLRESALAYGYDIDLAAIVDRGRPLGIPGGDELLRFVDTVTGTSSLALTDAQQSVIQELGPEALVDAAAVFGNFSMMNRIAEGTGIPLTRQMAAREVDLIETLGLTCLQKE